MNPHIEVIRRFLLNHVEHLNDRIPHMHAQSRKDAREAILFCQKILGKCLQLEDAAEKNTELDYGVCISLTDEPYDFSR